jgi:hypothetical protein
MLGDVKEHLQLGVRQVQLGGLLPEELAKGRAAQGVEEVEEPLGGIERRRTFDMVRWYTS